MAGKLNKKIVAIRYMLLLLWHIRTNRRSNPKTKKSTRHTERDSAKYPNHANLKNSESIDYTFLPKVSELLSIHKSPKWILRLFQRLSMTNPYPSLRGVENAEAIQIK